MGRFQKRRRKGRGRGQQQRQKSDWNGGEEEILTLVDRGNYAMEIYYAAQGMYNTRWDGEKLVTCEGDEEKQAERLLWRAACAKTLPASFRIAKDVPRCLVENMETELHQILTAARKEGKQEPVRTLKFLPHAYQLEMDRTTIRKNPDLAALHEWLKQQTQAGYITRQELVSMVPPVVLSPQPSDLVLDMCAAPGSKTSQMMEDLGPQGCVVANDANNKRAQ